MDINFHSETALQLLASFVIGTIIGIEREYKSKAAGLRTMIMICLGSTIFTELSIAIGGGSQDRIASNIITGIGFLGAGTIIQSRGTISGLTSAATIWVVAGIGLLVGAGFPWLALLGSVLTVATLNILHRIEPRLLGKCHFVGCNIIYVDDGGRTRSEIASLLSEHDIDITKLETEKVDQKSSRLRINFCDKHPTHHRFLSELWRTQGIVEITRDAPNGGR